MILYFYFLNFDIKNITETLYKELKKYYKNINSKKEYILHSYFLIKVLLKVCHLIRILNYYY